MWCTASLFVICNIVRTYKQQDRKMIITRAGGLRPMMLSQCHVAPHLRFTFFDQVHTTGMDIKQALSCTAAVTLGKISP
jgi:hypothetical protein